MKTSKEELMKAISGDLIIYLKSGYLSPKPFLNKLNLNIDRIENLIKIHFLLLPEVRDYILNLPLLIRNLKTSTFFTNAVCHNEVRGSIHWQNTLSLRLNTNYRDNTLFVCNEIDKWYNTKENIVLKKFIETVYNIIFVDIHMDRFADHSWYVKGECINRIIKQIYEKNIYMSRIDTEKIHVTARMIEDVTKNRNPLYSTAAVLLNKYLDLINLNIDQTMIKELFEKTFVEVIDENTLFELYWIINIIRKNASNSKMYIVDGTNNIVASWQDDNFHYNIYHDSVGSSNLMFSVELDEVKDTDNEYLKRKIAVINNTKSISKMLFDDISFRNNFWSGRPDILLEVIEKNTGNLAKIIVGEVKYTANKSYMIQGLEELLEYIYFVKEKSIQSNYIYNNDYSHIDIQGVLFVDKIDFNPLPSHVHPVHVCSTILKPLSFRFM